MNIKTGDVLTVNQVRVGSGIMYIEFSAGKSQQFVFLYLGIEPTNGSKPLNTVERMEKLGWVRKDE